MAITKTTKMTKKATEVLTIAQLNAQLLTEKNTLLELKRSHRMGELINPRVITVTRKKIARTLTAIRAVQNAKSKGDK